MEYYKMERGKPSYVSFLLNGILMSFKSDGFKKYNPVLHYSVGFEKGIDYCSPEFFKSIYKVFMFY